MALSILQTVYGLGLIFALECSCVVLSMVTRDALFLSMFSISTLPYVTIGMSCMTGYIIQKTSLWKLTMPNVFFVSGCGLFFIGSALLCTTSQQYTSCGILVLYLWIEVSNQIITSQFWNFVGQLFDIQQSKLYFGQIAFGSTIGTLITGVVLIPTFRYFEISTTMNVFIVGALLWCCAGLWCILSNSMQVDSNAVTQKKSSITKGNDKRIWTRLRDNRYLQHMALFEIMATIVRVLIDFQTLKLLSKESEEGMKSVLGLINALQSCLMIPLQYFASTIFTRFGVLYGVATMPVATCVFGIFTMASSAHLPLILSRGLYNGVTYAIFNTSRELLWLPLRSEEKDSCKSLVYGPIRSSARIGGAVLSLVLNAMTSNDQRWLVSCIITTLGLLWLLDAFSARRSYALEFYKSLKQGHIDFNSPHVDILPNQVAVIKDTLLNGDLKQVQFILSIIPSSSLHPFGKELKNIFYTSNTPEHVQLQILHIHSNYLKKSSGNKKKKRGRKPFSITFSAHDLLQLAQQQAIKVNNATSCSIQCAAINTCSFLTDEEDQSRCVGIFQSMLQEEMQLGEREAQLDACLSIALLRLTKWTEAAAHIRIHQMLHTETNTVARVNALRQVGKQLPELIGNGYLVYLLHHPSMEVAKAAVSICQYRNPQSDIILSTLLSKLTTPDLFDPVIHALTTFDPTKVWNLLVPWISKQLNHSKDWEGEVGRMTISGVIRLCSTSMFPLASTVDLLLSVLESIIEEEQGNEGNIMATYTKANRKWSWLGMVEELIDAIFYLVKSSDRSFIVLRIENILDLQLRHAVEVKQIHVLLTERVADVPPSTLLQYIAQICRRLNRIVFKLSSVYIPHHFYLHWMLEMLESPLEEIRMVMQEVLQNVLPSRRKMDILSLFFPFQEPPLSSPLWQDEIKNAMSESHLNHLLGIWLRGTNRAFSALVLEFAVEDTVFPWKKLDIGKVLREIQENHLSMQVIQGPIVWHPHVPLEVAQLGQSLDTTQSRTHRLQIASRLHQCRALHEMDLMELLHAVHRASQTHLDASTKIISENKTGDEVYIISSGRIQLHVGDHNIQQVDSGACIGLLRLFQRESVAKTIFSATTITPCEVISINRMLFMDLIATHKSVARGILREIVHHYLWVAWHEMRNRPDSPISRDRNHSSRQLIRLKSLAQDHVVDEHAEKETTIEKKTPIKKERLFFRAASSPKMIFNDRRPSYEIKSSFRRRADAMKKQSSFFPHHRPDDSRSYRSLSMLERCIGLKGSRMFQQLQDDEVAMVAQLSVAHSFDPQQIIYENENNAEGIWMLITGQVELQFPTVPHRSVSSSSYFGQESLLPGRLYIGRALAIASCQLLMLPGHELIELALEHPRILNVVMTSLVTDVEHALLSLPRCQTSPPPSLISLRNRNRATSE